MFKDTIEEETNVKVIKVPIFLPVIIEQEEDGFYTARTYGFPRCKGYGNSEEEAVQQLKEEIDRYNKSCIKIDKKMKMEEMVKRIFPNEHF